MPGCDSARLAIRLECDLAIKCADRRNIELQRSDNIRLFFFTRTPYSSSSIPSSEVKETLYLTLAKTAIATALSWSSEWGRCDVGRILSWKELCWSSGTNRPKNLTTLLTAVLLPYTDCWVFFHSSVHYFHLLNFWKVQLKFPTFWLNLVPLRPFWTKWSLPSMHCVDVFNYSKPQQWARNMPFTLFNLKPKIVPFGSSTCNMNIHDKSPTSIVHLPSNKNHTV